MFFLERVQGGAWVLPRTAACNRPYGKRNGDVPIQNFFCKINNELQSFNSPKPCYTKYFLFGHLGCQRFLLDLRMSFQNVPEMQVKTRLTVGYVEYFAIKQKTSGTQGYLRPNPEIYLIS